MLNGYVIFYNLPFHIPYLHYVPLPHEIQKSAISLVEDSLNLGVRLPGMPLKMRLGRLLKKPEVPLKRGYEKLPQRKLLELEQFQALNQEADSFDGWSSFA